MIERLEILLRCPTCKGLLEGDESRFYCPECDFSYTTHEGLLDLLPAGSSELKLSEREHFTEKTDYYLSMHDTWSGSPFYRHYHQAFLEELRRLPRGSLILELGCGLGHDGLELLRSGYNMVETDIAPGQLGEARRLHGESGLEASSAHLLADAENLPFASGVFDGAFMVASLHHLPDPLRSLREIRRVLKPGGIFALGTEPNNWQNRTIYPLGKMALRLVNRILGKEIDPSQMVSEADKLAEGFSYEELNDLFREAGFEQWTLKPAGYLSAAVFFLSTELSQLIGFDLRLFPLESVFIPLDELLGRTPFFHRYPWHWNAAAR
jgi:ubiquinone/menaquinone biosynthesis C-methylase UbiE